MSGFVRHEPRGLVVDVRRDLAEAISVFASVMGAEQELATRGEAHPNVCAGAATVAAIGCRQWCG